MPRLGRLILTNLLLDFVTVRAYVGPRVDEILSSQARLRTKQVRLARSDSPCLFEKPDGNPRAHDARFAAAYTWVRVDVRERVSEVANNGECTAVYRKMTGLPGDYGLQGFTNRDRVMRRSRVRRGV